MKNKLNKDSSNNAGENEVITISSNELKRLYGVIVAYEKLIQEYKNELKRYKAQLEAK
jgi:hypothetical protein